MLKRLKKPVTLRNAGPVEFSGTRFPLNNSSSLDYVQGVHRLVFRHESFLIVLYGAMNVNGLIGTEHNGIAVLWENNGKVLLTDHYRDSSYMKASNQQRAEYERICAMDAAAFKEFANGHAKVWCRIMDAKPKPIIKPKLGYKAVNFEKTKFDAALDKVLFLEALIKFLCHRCDRDRFTRRVYDGLHQHLGHIAHYNMDGFYTEWFDGLESRVRFLEHHANYLMLGGWGDVDAALKQWIKGPEGQAVLAYYKNAIANDRESAERQQLAALKAKYETPSGNEVQREKKETVGPQ